MSGALRVGLVGFGKIARDQHLPAISGTPGMDLLAVASWTGTANAVTTYRELDEMLASEVDLDAIILCQPPQARFEAARAAILAGKHVFLEKPPGTTPGEVETLAALASEQGVTLFASWHSRYGAAVDAAKRWLAKHTITGVAITWKEDVRQWHPGQEWIWQEGGFGVFDPGINALSILTDIVPGPIRLVDAELETPVNRQAPIAARLTMASADGAPITAEFDWRQTGPQIWDIVVTAAGETLSLGHGGNALAINGVAQPVDAEAEYPAMYRHFAALIAAGHSDVDIAPLQIVADSFLHGRSCATKAFDD